MGSSARNVTVTNVTLRALLHVMSHLSLRAAVHVMTNSSNYVFVPQIHNLRNSVINCIADMGWVLDLDF